MSGIGPPSDFYLLNPNVKWHPTPPHRMYIARSAALSHVDRDNHLQATGSSAMPSLKPYSGPTKLVLAFDIGTTYSGISYCILERGHIPEIFGVRKFPAQLAKAHGYAKVPSLLYYDKDGKMRAAGAEVLAEQTIETALQEGWTRAEWWKLHLRPKHLASSIRPDDDLPPLPTGKSAVDVLTDFIAYLFQCAKKYIEERHLSFLWSSALDSIEFIFTHPNGWEGVQQQQYRRAIENAGLVPSTPEGRSRVHMLTDGEASLHFCVADCVADLLEATTDQLSPHGVVIIDVGGGTVDLSMFSMTSNPISCKEIAPAECRLQGSIFVTRRARALLERKLEGWDHASPKEISYYTREFDRTTKLSIKSSDEPAYIKVAGLRTNNTQYNIRLGKLNLSGGEATGIFDESVDAVTSAFEQQEKSATTKITTAFLVGGFSKHDWLWSRLQSYFKEKNIKICRPDNHHDTNKAVAHGAVLSYVNRDKHLVASRVLRATYGVIRALPVKATDEEHARKMDQWEKVPSGDSYVPGHFKAMLHKGDQVREDVEFRESFSLSRNSPRDFGLQTLRVMCYHGDLSNPKWVDEDQTSFSGLCTISADLSQAKTGVVTREENGQVFYELDYDVIILFGHIEIQAQLAWKTKKGEQRIPATVLFES